MMRITGDSFAVQTMIMNGLLPILSALVLLVGMIAVLVPLDLARARIPLGAARIAYAGLIILMICTGLLGGLALGGVTLPVTSPGQK